jgi:hypothetical protein
MSRGTGSKRRPKGGHQAPKGGAQGTAKGGAQPAKPGRQAVKRPLRKPVSRTPQWLPGAAIVGGIAVLVVGFLLVRWVMTPAPPVIDTTQSAAVLATLTNLPPSELEQVGMGSASNPVKRVTGDLLTGAGGKPEVFYYGAEYCPYCAVERWPMIIALSRFGSFSGLQTTTSSSTDIYPNTPTFSFRAVTFTSQYIDFQAVETTDRNQSPLQSPSAAQLALVRRYDTGGSIPFVDFGNQYAFAGATYIPDVLNGMSWQAIATSLQQADSLQAKAILGSANLITAAICKVTSDQPASVCSGAAIQAIESKL